MRNPTIYAPRRRTRRRAPKMVESRNAGDTNISCGCLIFVFALMTLLARHGWLYTESIREFVTIFGGA